MLPLADTETLVAIPLLSILGAAALIDWRTHSLPNTLSFGGAVFALILHGTLSGFSGVAIGMAGWLLCLGLFLPFYVAGGMAAGDVKLMAAVGAFVGPIAGVVACLFTMIAGGLIGIATLVIARRACLAEDVRPGTTGTLREQLKTRIPYAGAIAAGTSIMLIVPGATPSVFSQFGVS